MSWSRVIFAVIGVSCSGRDRGRVGGDGGIRPPEERDDGAATGECGSSGADAPAKSVDVPADDVVQRPTRWAGDREADDDGRVGEDVLGAVVPDPQALAAVVGARRDDHGCPDERGAERDEQARRDRRAAEHLVGAADTRHEAAMPKADGLHVAGGAVKAEAAEPAEQLLGAMTEHERADRQLDEKETCVHGGPPIEVCANALITITQKYVHVHYHYVHGPHR